MESKSVIYRQCRKEIKTEIHKCTSCEKMFHPSCAKLHRVYNTDKELVHCKGKIEVHLAKPSANVGAEAAGGSDKEAKASKSDGCRTMGSSMDTKQEEILIRVKELKDEVGEFSNLRRLLKPCRRKWSK